MKEIINLLKKYNVSLPLPSISSYPDRFDEPMTVVSWSQIDSRYTLTIEFYWNDSKIEWFWKDFVTGEIAGTEDNREDEFTTELLEKLLTLTKERK